MKRLALFLVALACLLTPRAGWADTYVYVHNNTPFAFDARVDTNLSTEYWKRGESVVPAGKQRLRMMQTNRDSGIKSGKNYEFRIVLTPRGGGNPVGLKLKLRGTTFFSDLWQSVDGDGWYGDRGTHNRSFNLGSFALNVKYRAYFTGGADDVEFILQYRYPACNSADKNTLHLLTYNTYMRPTNLFINGQSARTPLIANWVRGQGYDAILFNELFDDPIRNQMVNALRSEFPYATRVVGTDRGFDQDGGVLVVSRWPIVAQDQKLFGRTSAGSDSMADKGVIYACIDKQGKKYHIFGSHTQSTRTPSDYNTDAAVRRQQFGIMRQFIDSKNIPASEAVIVGGDLNVDRANGGEYNGMVSTLGVVAPMYLGWGQTWDPTINLCCDSGRAEYLDYLFADGKHLRPIEITNESRIARSLLDEWKSLPTERARWDLSDHFPVYGAFKFPARTIPIFKTTIPDGIKLPAGSAVKIIKP